MTSLESAIDDLYKQPLVKFISTRAAIAKSVTGAEAKRVKGLAKPTAVAWATNQVHWHDRPTYDRLVKTGEKLRSAQIAALKGRSVDVRAASAAHRAAVGDAVKAASRLASADGVHPDADALARMFEAVSLTAAPPERHGRFTKVLTPAGFEALTGVEIAPVSRAESSRYVLHEVPKRGTSSALQAERERLAAERQKQAAVRKAESAVSDARAAEARAREAWERAKRALQDAEQALDIAKT